MVIMSTWIRPAGAGAVKIEMSLRSFRRPALTCKDAVNRLGAFDRAGRNILGADSQNLANVPIEIAAPAVGALAHLNVPGQEAVTLLTQLMDKAGKFSEHLLRALPESVVGLENYLSPDEILLLIRNRIADTRPFSWMIPSELRNDKDGGRKEFLGGLLRVNLIRNMTYGGTPAAEVTREDFLGAIQSGVVSSRDFARYYGAPDIYTWR